MTVNNDSLLFVYGTLCRGQRAHRMLRGKTRYLGEAWMAGTLYNLGRYPGAIHNGQQRRPTKVHGELYRLRHGAHLLQRLDAYEGLVQNGGEYRRERVTVARGRRRLSAWVYLYEPSTGYRRPLTSGRYRPTNKS